MGNEPECESRIGPAAAGDGFNSLLQLNDGGYALRTNSDFRPIAPMPSILQSIL